MEDLKRSKKKSNRKSIAVDDVEKQRKEEEALKNTVILSSGTSGKKQPNNAFTSESRGVSNHEEYENEPYYLIPIKHPIEENSVEFNHQSELLEEVARLRRLIEENLLNKAEKSETTELTTEEGLESPYDPGELTDKTEEIKFSAKEENNQVDLEEEVEVKTNKSNFKESGSNEENGDPIEEKWEGHAVEVKDPQVKSKTKINTIKNTSRVINRLEQDRILREIEEERKKEEKKATVEIKNSTTVRTEDKEEKRPKQKIKDETKVYPEAKKPDLTEAEKRLEEELSRKEKKRKKLSFRNEFPTEKIYQDSYQNFKNRKKLKELKEQSWQRDNVRVKTEPLIEQAYKNPKQSFKVNNYEKVVQNPDQSLQKTIELLRKKVEAPNLPQSFDVDIEKNKPKKKNPRVKISNNLNNLKSEQAGNGLNKNQEINKKQSQIESNAGFKFKIKESDSNKKTPVAPKAPETPKPEVSKNNKVNYNSNTKRPFNLNQESLNKEIQNSPKFNFKLALASILVPFLVIGFVFSFGLNFFNQAQNGDVAGATETVEEKEVSAEEQEFIDWGKEKSGKELERNEDEDGDGLTNYEEFLLKTDPTNQNSCNEEKTDMQNLLSLINPATCENMDLNKEEDFELFSQIFRDPNVQTKVVKVATGDEIAEDESIQNSDTLLDLFGVGSYSEIDKFNQSEIDSNIENNIKKAEYLKTIKKIDEYITKYRSYSIYDRDYATPASAAVYLETSIKYDTPLKYILAIGRLESRFGTDRFTDSGNPTRIHNHQNIFSMGLDDSGNNITFNSWEDGVYSFGRWYRYFDDKGVGDCQKWRIYNPNGDYCSKVEATANQIDVFLKSE